MEKFTILEEETGTPLTMVVFSMRAFLKQKSIIGASLRNFLFYRKGNYFKLGFILDEFTNLGNKVLKHVITDDKFTKKILTKIRTLSKQLFNFSLIIRNTDLVKKNNKSLSRIYQKYSKILEELYLWGLLPELMEVHNNLFSKFVEKELKKTIHKKGIRRNVGEYLSVLTIPTEESFAKKEEKSFLNLVWQINKDFKIKKIFENKDIKEIKDKLAGSLFDKKINQYLEKYCWVNYNYEGPAMDKESLIDLLRHAIKAFDPQEKIKELINREKRNKENQQKFLKELNPDEFLKRLLELAKSFLTLKMIRKESIFHSCYAIDKVRAEVSRRLGITLAQSRCMLPEEFVKAVELNKVNKAELKARKKEVAYFIENGKEKILTGREARKLVRLFIKIGRKELNQLQGSCASVGKVSGMVKIIRDVRDMPKMNQGDILVAMATNPTFVPAMKKAAAIVTDMGGIT